MTVNELIDLLSLHSGDAQVEIVSYVENDPDAGAVGHWSLHIPQPGQHATEREGQLASGGHGQVQVCEICCVEAVIPDNKIEAVPVQYPAVEMMN